MDRIYLDYIIILDFEAICVEDHLPKPKPQEIIEFPSILLDLKTQNIIDVYHFYVKPQIHSLLSDFCTKLTGITQPMVNGGIPLSDAINHHQDWLIKNGMFDNRTNSKIKNWAYLTCGNWDLGTCLPENCLYYGLNIPNFFNDWIDIKLLYESFYGRKTRGMKSMLEELHLPLLGNHHSGIDDCRNIANIVKTMLSSGCRFLLNQEHQIDPRFIREEDWICSYCNTHNFSLKEVCRKCAKPLDSTSIRAQAKLAVRPKPGDWLCAGCQQLNFSFRMDCFSCGKKKPDDSRILLNQNLLPGDWNCKKCGVINYAFRKHCFKCNSPLQ